MGMEGMRELRIDPSNLDQELGEQAAKFLFAAECHVMAEGEWKDYDLAVEVLEAKLSTAARDAIKEKGEKPTEKAVENIVVTQASYIAAHKKLDELWVKKETAKALRDAWYARKDMLIQISINQRSERSLLDSETVKAA